MAKDIVESSILKLCTYEDCVYLESLEIYDQLLPSEVGTILVPKVSMIELTTTMELFLVIISMWTTSCPSPQSAWESLSLLLWGYGSTKP